MKKYYILMVLCISWMSAYAQTAQGYKTRPLQTNVDMWETTS